MIAINISIESLAAMLAEAHRDGWEDGRNLCPHDPQAVYLEYQDAVERLCDAPEDVRH